MGECKTKAIQTNLGTFRHNQTYSGIIQACLEPCLTLKYLKLWYIQNPNIFRSRSIFRTPAYSWPCYIPNAGIFKIWGIFGTPLYICDEALIIFTDIIIFTNYNYFRKACRAEIKTWVTSGSFSRGIYAM